MTHRLLSRQLKKLGLSAAAPPDENQWRSFLNRVDMVYHDAEQDRYQIERSLTIASREMNEVYNQLRQSSESRVRQERDRLQSVISSMGEGLCALDAKGQVMVINEAAEKLLGECEDDLIGQSVFSRFMSFDGADDPELSEANLIARLRRGEAYRNDEVLLRCSVTGNQIPVSFLLNPIVQNERVVGGVLVFRDITERMAASEALRKSQEQFQSVAETTPIPMLMSRVHDGVVLFGNAALAELIDIDLSDVIGQQVPDFYDDPVDRETILAALEATGEVLDHELRLRKADGTLFWATISARMIEFDGQPTVLTGIYDISQIKLVEAALQASEARYRTITDLTSDYIYSMTIDPDGPPRDFQATDRFRDITGFSAEELKAEGGLTRLLHPEDLPTLAERGKKLFGGEVDISEFRIMTHDGDVRWIRDYAKPVWDETGESVVGVTGAARDVTERRLAEEALRESDSRHRMLLRAVPDPVVIYDPDGLTTYINPAFTRVFGWTADDVLGRRIDFVPEDQMAETQAVIQRLIQGEEIVQFETRRFTKSGELRDMSISAARIADSDGNQMGMVILRDITERKRVQEVLDEQREFLRQIIDINPALIFAKNREGRFTLANQALADIYGTTVDNIIGKTDADFNPNPVQVAQFQREDRRVMDTLQESFLPEEVTTDVNGNVRWLQTIKRPIIGPDGTANQVLGVITDITRRKQVEAALQAQEAEYKQLVETASDILFTADVDGRFSFVNPVGVRITGLSEDELVGSNFLDLVRTDYRERTEAFYRQQVTMQTPTTYFEFPTVSLAVGEIWLGQNVQLIMDGDEVIALQAVSRDITERRRAAEEQERLNTILENTIDFVGMAEANGRMVFLNSAGRNMLAIEPDLDITQLNIPDFLPDGPGAQIINDGIQTAIETGTWTGETALLHRDGYTVDVSIVVMAHRAADGELQFLSAIARDIRDQKRQEAVTQQSLARRSRQVELTTAVAQQIAQAGDLEELYRRVVRLVKEEFGYYHTQLLRYDPALDTLVLVYGYGEIGERMRAMNHAMPVGIGLIGSAAARGRPVLAPEVANDLHWRPNSLLPETVGELAVPIKLGDQVLGVLDVQSNVRGQLTEEDQFVLEGLCGQIATAIESTRLRQQMVEQLNQLNDLQRVMSRDGWVEYWERQGGLRAAYRYDVEQAEAVPVAAPSNGKNGANGNSRLADDARVTPLAVRGEVIGALGLADDDRPLSSDEQELLDAVSVQVAEALEAARLFEQTQHALSEQERLASELETVAQMSTTASTILEEDKLLHSVVNVTKERFGFYHVNIFTLSPNGRDLQLKAGSGKVGEVLVAENLSIAVENPVSVVAAAARQREVVLVDDTSAAENYLPHPLLPDTRAEMAVPMVVGDTLVGVLDVEVDRPGHFTEQDKLIQQTLAAQVAVALQNAMLYAEQLATADRLREVDRLKSEFLASMSHELRTPLNSIIGFADVLLEGIDGELNDRMREDVSLIRNSGRHLRELIGNILDMSKIEAGMMTLRYEEVDGRRLADEVMATAGILAQEKSLTLTSNVGPGVGTLYADRTRLTQVMLNIIGNAIKFTEKGGVTLTMTVEGDDLVVELADTGIGISPEDLHIVFEQFRQVDGSLTRESGGTGLGMPISKKLVELHGGEIEVSSTVGEGTTFRFTIPNRQVMPEQ